MAGNRASTVAAAETDLVLAANPARSDNAAGTTTDNVTFSAPTAGSGNYSYAAVLSKPAGSSATLSGSGLGAYTISSMADGESYAVLLTVTDDDTSQTGVMTWVSTVVIPTASAGTDQTILYVEQVTLDGSGSDAGTYAWTLLDPYGTDRTSLLSDATAQSPTFTPYPIAGNWLAEITVDGSSSDAVSIIVGDNKGIALDLTAANTAGRVKDTDGILIGAPTKDGSGWFTVTFDASVIKNDPDANMALFYLDVPTAYLNHADAYSGTMVLEVDNDSEDKLIGIMGYADDTYVIGYWQGLSRETVATGYDHAVRRWNSTFPTVGSISTGQPLLDGYYTKNQDRSTSGYEGYGMDASPVDGLIQSAQTHTSPGTSGTIRMVVGIGCRAAGSASVTLQIRARFNLPTIISDEA